MAKCFQQLQRYSDVKFDLEFITGTELSSTNKGFT